jgi:UDP-2,4-diacetamido-2,4,6-trideoxy-beta-L-altropyranose hydrolase
LPREIDIETDIRLTKEILSKYETRPDWLIIDHYDIGISWEYPLRKYTKKLMVIDDLANRKHDCDLLLDQNYSKNEDRYNGLVPENCIQLLGPEYAILRPQFQKARENLIKRDGGVNRILVFMGGVDSKNITSKILRAINMLGRSGIAIDVVIGNLNPYHDEIKTQASHMPNTNCHLNIENMAEMMVAADLCIGGCGTATWERCYLGLPSIVLVLAENQRKIAENLDDEGAIINLGWCQNVKDSSITECISELINNPGKVQSMTDNSRNLVDGEGVNRVCDAMISKVSYIINLTKVEITDINDIFEWRNHPDIRRNFFNQELLSWEEHEKWFTTKLKDSNATVYMAYYKEIKVGTIRFESKDRVIKTSVMLNPLFLGKGLGSKVIKLGVERFIMEKKPDMQIIAEIKKDNFTSIKAFTKAGFKEKHLTFVYHA